MSRDQRANDNWALLTINGNELPIDASQARLTDILLDVEFLDADTQPSFNNGSVLIWNLGTLPANSTGTIQLYGRIDALYHDFPDLDSSSATIGLLDSLRTEFRARGHGSGSYFREELTSLKTNNCTIVNAGIKLSNYSGIKLSSST